MDVLLNKSMETVVYIFEMQVNRKLGERGRKRKCDKMQL
jgi:hypothetical protein